MSPRRILLLATAAASVSAGAAMAAELESQPSTTIFPIYPPAGEPGSVLSVPRDDSAPLTGDRPVLAPAIRDEPLAISRFTEPAPPPPPREVVAAIAPAAATPPAPRPQRSQPVRSAVRVAPPAATTPRRQPQPAQATPTRSTEPTRRIQPGWLLGVYR